MGSTPDFVLARAVAEHERSIAATEGERFCELEGSVQSFGECANHCLQVLARKFDHVKQRDVKKGSWANVYRQFLARL